MVKKIALNLKIFMRYIVNYVNYIDDHLNYCLIFSALSVHFTNIISSSHLLFANPNTGFGLCPWRGVSCFDKCMLVQDHDIHDIAQVTTSEGAFIVGITSSDIVIYKIFIRGNS